MSTLRERVEVRRVKIHDARAFEASLRHDEIEAVQRVVDKRRKKPKK